MKLSAVLAQPIPDLSEERELKKGFRDYPILDSARNDEPLVDIAKYGLAGQSYYSRPNSAIGAPVKDLEPKVLLRRSIAERLAAINYELQQSTEAEQIFGCKVELYVEDGWRPVVLQRRLHSEVFPALLQRQFPKLNKQEILRRRDDLIAFVEDGASPPPHATGAAFDLTLRQVQSRPDYVPHASVDMWGAKNHVEVVYPDHYEKQRPTNRATRAVLQRRRAFYWIMRGILQGEDTGFRVNPFEWWHWSYGDQMWAKLSKAPAAFYGLAPEQKPSGYGLLGAN